VDLRAKAIAACKQYEVSKSHDDYAIVRNFILCAMLFCAPPQRAQILNNLRGSQVKIKSDRVEIVVPEHKTAYKYGPAVIVLPEFIVPEFRQFVDMASDECILAERSEPLFVGREKSIKALDDAMARNREIFLAAQKKPKLQIQ
jgi:hypothetical protein